jgi:hypothetical protein
VPAVERPYGQSGGSRIALQLRQATSILSIP